MVFRKLSLMLVVFIAICSSAFALDFSFDQTQNIQDYNNNDHGNIQLYDFVGSTNQNITFPDSNNTYQYDFFIEYTEMADNFYFIINNAYVNQTVQFMWRGDLSRDDTIYIQNFTLEEAGTYYFKFEPEYVDEPGRIYMEVENSFVGTIKITEENPKTFNDLMGGLVDAFVDIVSLNVAFWRILLYTTIAIIGFALIGAIFGFAFIIFGYVKKLKQGGLDKDTTNDRGE